MCRGKFEPFFTALSCTTMFEVVRSLMADVTLSLDLAEKITSPTLREAIIGASQAALLEAGHQLTKKKYVLPKSPKVVSHAVHAVHAMHAMHAMPARPAYVPWTPAKTDFSSFRSTLVTFLRESFPERNPKVNLAEAGKLWTLYKDAGSLDEAISCAKMAVTSSLPETRLRSVSEESI
jgi:hypothetical protein